ncbi:MAG: hypothetical protein KGR98_14605 [Verrucomicrobia bacterium]|nr:hypothetical protein [Verrucomicrobiota bacterium]MDE3099381.1 hypothetical protein [Verrucomicrobiota bacterium]
MKANLFEFRLQPTDTFGAAASDPAKSLAKESMPPDEQTSPEQIAAWRAMTGVRRWRLAEGLYWTARKLTLAGLRARHPGWPEERLAEELRRILRRSRT